MESDESFPQFLMWEVIAMRSFSPAHLKLRWHFKTAIANGTFDPSWTFRLWQRRSRLPLPAEPERPVAV